jgi:hypothetical protein
MYGAWFITRWDSGLCLFGFDAAAESGSPNRSSNFKPERQVHYKKGAHNKGGYSDQRSRGVFHRKIN